MIDLSSVDVEYKEVKMIINEDDIGNESNYDLLCNTIDDKIGKQFANWRYSFAIVDSTNGDSILGLDDLTNILTIYMDNNSNSSKSSIVILLKMEGLSQTSSNSSNTKKVYDSTKELKKLKTYQSYWNDPKKLDMSINDCDLEMDFICENLKNIRQCVKILTDECKMELNKEDIISKEDSISMEKRFNHLLESLTIESLSTTHIYDDVVESKDAALKYEWSKAFLKIKKTLNELRPFDIKKMLHLYDQTAAAAKRVEGKDICLLLGHTGMFALCFLPSFFFSLPFSCQCCWMRVVFVNCFLIHIFSGKVCCCVLV